MKRMHFLTAVVVALAVGACGISDPTAPAVDTLETLEVSLDQRATVDPQDPFDVDENENGIVCVKIVPASEDAAERAGERVIVKDDRDRQCPGGFELGGLAG